MNWKSGIVSMMRKTLSVLGLQHVWTESGKYLKDDFLSARNQCPLHRHEPSILLLKHKIHCACRAIGCGRSEEHTSELQSRFDLVCRLLLEKKNKTKIIP